MSVRDFIAEGSCLLHVELPQAVDYDELMQRADRRMIGMAFDFGRAFHGAKNIQWRCPYGPYAKAIWHLPCVSGMASSKLPAVRSAVLTTCTLYKIQEAKRNMMKGMPELASASCMATENTGAQWWDANGHASENPRLHLVDGNPGFKGGSV